MAANPPFDEPSDKDVARPADKTEPSRPVRHDQPVEFPESDSAVSQADGVP